MEPTYNLQAPPTHMSRLSGPDQWKISSLNVVSQSQKQLKGTPVHDHPGLRYVCLFSMPRSLTFGLEINCTEYWLLIFTVGYIFIDKGHHPARSRQAVASCHLASGSWGPQLHQSWNVSIQARLRESKGRKENPSQSKLQPCLSESQQAKQPQED